MMNRKIPPSWMNPSQAAVSDPRTPTISAVTLLAGMGLGFPILQWSAHRLTLVVLTVRMGSGFLILQRLVCHLITASHHGLPIGNRFPHHLPPSIPILIPRQVRLCNRSLCHPAIWTPCQGHPATHTRLTPMPPPSPHQVLCQDHLVAHHHFCFRTLKSCHPQAQQTYINSQCVPYTAVRFPRTPFTEQM